MEYLELKNEITEHLNSAASNFFTIGYLLRQINEGALYREDGYGSIWEFAKGEYGLSASSASRFMGINERFSIDGGRSMDKKWVGMGASKLQEMLTLSDEDLEKVTGDMTVRQIRDMKKKSEPVSYYGFAKSVYPEGSLLSTAGCGNVHDCFSCAMSPCEIRQEDRYCMDAPLGNPFACRKMSEKARKGMELGTYAKTCQFLNLEFARKRAGDQEPSPCCKECGAKSSCHLACVRAKDEVEAKEQARKKESPEIETEIHEEELEQVGGETGTISMAKLTEKLDAVEQENMQTVRALEIIEVESREGEGGRSQEDESKDGSSPEDYSLMDVRRLLWKEEKNLEDARKVGHPQPFTVNTRIMYDALRLLEEKMKA